MPPDFPVGGGGRGGSRIFIWEGLQVLGAPFLLAEERYLCLEGSVMGEKATFYVTRAPQLAVGATFLLRRAPSW